MFLLLVEKQTILRINLKHYVILNLLVIFSTSSYINIPPMPASFLIESHHFPLGAAAVGKEVELLKECDS